VQTGLRFLLHGAPLQAHNEQDNLHYDNQKLNPL
jgi:hypothetical protein